MHFESQDLNMKFYRIKIDLKYEIFHFESV